MKPDPRKQMELYVDADFAGEWTRATSLDPRASLSMTGFVLNYAGCPIVWKSTLQTTIALSTAEAEYLALSTALRTTMPILRLLREVSTHMPGLADVGTTIKCKVYEDKESTIKIANGARTTHRTKHISTKVHHFRQYIRDKSIKVVHIASDKQIADMLTKPLMAK